jgi:hypothetical protein
MTTDGRVFEILNQSGHWSPNWRSSRDVPKSARKSAVKTVFPGVSGLGFFVVSVKRKRAAPIAAKRL